MCQEEQQVEHAVLYLRHPCHAGIHYNGSFAGDIEPLYRVLRGSVLEVLTFIHLFCVIIVLRVGVGNSNTSACKDEPTFIQINVKRLVLAAICSLYYHPLLTPRFCTSKRNIILTPGLSKLVHGKNRG